MGRLDGPFWVNDEGQRCFCHDADAGSLSRLEAVRRLMSEPKPKRGDAAIWGARLAHLFEFAFGPWRGQPVIGHELARQ